MRDYTRRVLVLQHAEHEHLGRIAEVLDEETVEYSCLRGDLGDPIPATLGGYDGLIVLGGPQSVYEEEQHPFLRAEKALVRSSLVENRPVLGICLGSQIIADVLGARVYPGTTFEIGWREVTLLPEAVGEGVTGHLPEVFTPLHWHGDVFDLPLGAKAVARSVQTPVQGFVWNDNVFGLLFHLEFTLDQLVAMVASFPGDLIKGSVAPPAILAGAREHLDALRTPAMEFFRRWTTLYVVER